MQALKEDPSKLRRISFNEITKTAVKASIKQPRDLDLNLVDAQQARRMLDRMVGYTISPLLWVKVKRGLSAGRVQSVALRIICDREEEINSFIPEEYWSLDGEFKIKGEKKPLQAKFYGTDKKLPVHNRAEMDKILKALENAEYEITEVKKGERTKNAPLPFTTSTLQQGGCQDVKLFHSENYVWHSSCMKVWTSRAVVLLVTISYLRTDSTNLTGSQIRQQERILKRSMETTMCFTTGKTVKKEQKIQDAHEAIRPTDITRLPAMIKESCPEISSARISLSGNVLLPRRMSAANMRQHL